MMSGLNGASMEENGVKWEEKKKTCRKRTLFAAVKKKIVSGFVS